MKALLFINVLLLFQSCQAQQIQPMASNPDNNSLLWEISGKGITKPSYLFGTFHLMCSEDIHLSPNLRQSIGEAEEIYFEMDLDDPSNTLGALFLMNMKDGKTLKDFYTEKEYQRLAAFIIDSLQMPFGLLQKMKPAFLEVLLYPKLMACKKMSGVEEELMSIAQQGKKEIRGFETIAMQSAVFDSIPYEEQAQSLLKTIDSLQEYKKYFDTMLTVYKNQQLSQIEALFTNSEFGMNDRRDILLDRRNKNWVIQLMNLLPQKKLFIAVGAGHLVGEKGVIALLKKEGYTLRPIKNN